MWCWLVYKSTLAQSDLPGIALAQRTTVTSCLSPSSLRLVSKDAGLSGCAWSCPALTTAGSMACKTLSRERQERTLGGIPEARQATEDIQKKSIKVTLQVKLYLSGVDETLILTLSRYSCTSRLQDGISVSPGSRRKLLLSAPRLSGSLKPTT